MGWGTVGRAGLEVCWLWVQAGAQGECYGPAKSFRDCSDRLVCRSDSRPNLFGNHGRHGNLLTLFPTTQLLFKFLESSFKLGQVQPRCTTPAVSNDCLRTWETTKLKEDFSKICLDP